MHALHRVAKDCPRTSRKTWSWRYLSSLNFSRDLVRHNQCRAIFNFNDKVAVSTPSGEEASKSSPDHAASMPKYEDSTYIEDRMIRSVALRSLTPRQLCN